MLSKKMTVSLMSLITILAFAFTVTAEAQLTVNLTQYNTGDEAVKNPPDVDSVKAGHQLRLTGVTDPAVLTFTVMTDTVLTGDINASTVINDKILVLQTVTDSEGNETVSPSNAESITRVGATGFSFTIDPANNTTSITVEIAAGSFGDDQVRTSLTVEFLGAIVLDAPVEPVNDSRPRVVSIQRLRPGSQTVVAAFQEAEVTGPFTVRIVTTEKAHDLALGHINVANGTASGFVVGTPFSWFGGNTSQNEARPMSNASRAYTIIPHPAEGMYQHNADGVLAGVPQGSDGFVPLPTGDDEMYHQYRVEITPHRRASSVSVSVKEFHDNATPYKNFYQPVDLDEKPNGREQLTLTVNIPRHNLEAGYRVYLPHQNGADFPADGFYLLTNWKWGSHIDFSNEEGDANPDRENKATEQTVAQLKYNVRQTSADIPQERVRTADEPQWERGTMPNLETFLANNGTIHLVSYVRDGAKPKYKEGDLYISEVMWGTDASQNVVHDSNWIEIRRVGGKIDVGAQEWALWFFQAHETPPTNADYQRTTGNSYEGPIGQPGELIDVLSTKRSDTDLSWSITGKGNSGRSGIDLARDLGPNRGGVLAPITPLTSMYRALDADDKPLDGTLPTSWMQSTGPSVNLRRGSENAIIATPGSDEFDTPDEVKAEEDEQKAKDKAAADKLANTGTYPKQGQGRVYISEIMFAGGGTLPQWIEISNGDRSTDFNLSGWTLTIVNAAADADVNVGATATFTIPDGTTIDASAQHDTPSTILVVTEAGRNNLTGEMASKQVINLAVDNEVELITAGVLTGKYTLLSDMAFQITLAPPVPEAKKAPAGETAAAKTTRLAEEKKERVLRTAATDMVGNLGKDGAALWALPTNAEGGRSSIIRRHIDVVRGPAAPRDGMMEDNWVLASETSFADVTHIRASSYYGAANDVGTPGFRAGGALPVELSHFRPTRDKATGQVVITWSTQSELNNAGFFIKRAQQRNGEFKVINATMIAGAGTTSEKQFYTYTDTTAQPNVVYYYQIEDVSLDGNRQTLTRGIRLKGHIGAAGKLTSLWGELKSSNE